MLRVGKKQELTVIKQVHFGIYLAQSQEDSEKVLLPQKEVPEGTEIGTRMEVFLYKDSKDRLIATRRTPALEVGQTACLTVKEVGKIGAFLEWGLEKDLLLPFKEQTKKVREQEKVLVALYIDKSSRLCATMKIYPYLSQNSPYQKEDHVKGMIYEVSAEFGAFVAVDGKYSGLIQAKEAANRYHPGDEVELRVTGVKPDGKLDLSAREKAYLQIDEDAEAVMEAIEEFDGVLPFNDKVSPDIIQREFGLSKNAFKRAVGRLLKQGRIEITQNRIKKIK